MSRRVFVTIDRLMLHGVSRADSVLFSAALQAELHSLFSVHAAAPFEGGHPAVVKTVPIRSDASGAGLGHAAAGRVFKAIVR